MLCFQSDFLPIAPPLELGDVEMPVVIWGSGKERLNWGCIYFGCRGIYLCGLQSLLCIVKLFLAILVKKWLLGILLHTGMIHPTLWNECAGPEVGSRYENTLQCLTQTVGGWWRRGMLEMSPKTRCEKFWKEDLVSVKTLSKWKFSLSGVVSVMQYMIIKAPYIFFSDENSEFIRIPEGRAASIAVLPPMHTFIGEVSWFMHSKILHRTYKILVIEYFTKIWSFQMKRYTKLSLIHQTTIKKKR